MAFFLILLLALALCLIGASLPESDSPQMILWKQLTSLLSQLVAEVESLMSKLVRLLPRYTTTTPTPEPAGAMTHLMIAKTQFGGARTSDLNDWYFGPPLFRVVKQMSGNPDDILSRNPNGVHMPYCLLWSAVGDTPGNNEYNSFWVQLAEQWAVANGYDPEDLFIHSALNQRTLQSQIDTIDADGTVHLGLIGGHYYRTTLMNVGDEYIISDNSNVDFNGQHTILQIIDYKTLVIDKTSSASGTKGSIYQLGNGSKTKANRFWFFLWDNWRYTFNPGTPASSAWAVFKHGKTLGTQSKGVFYDEFDSTDVKGVSLEYPLDADYEADMNNLLSVLKTTYPGTLVEVNIGSYTKEADFNFSAAAGSCQLEQFSNAISAYSVDSVISWIKRLLAANVTVEMPIVPEWRIDAGRHMFLPGAFSSTGGHLYATPEARCMIVSYALYMQLVDSDTRPYGSYHLYWNPMPGKSETIDPELKWFPHHEHNIGKAMGPYYILADGNIAQDGGSVRIYARKFSKDGVTPYCLMLHYRSRQGGAGPYGSATSYNVPVETAPPGTDWWLLDENGNFSQQIAGSITLWCADAAFLIAVPR